ncbi:MAG: hypothetical protein IT429_03705 [Gemmataceae bacterium]|nr:hypothetical protein [Gemmataceae bacterium]
MRAPEAVGLGNAKVTLSFPAWKEGNVAPATLTVPVVMATPRAVPVPKEGKMIDRPKPAKEK